MTSPQISVILPVYNGAEFISEAIQSILDQSYTDFELLIIDDGSTDDGMRSITKFKDQRIRILENKKNEGLIATLNKGIAESKGHFLARMDADDISHPDRFEKQVHFLKNNPSVGVCGTLMHMIHNNKVYIHRFKESKLIKASFLFTNPIVHPSVMMRKDLFPDTASAYDKNFLHAEDYALWISLLPKTDFAVLALPLISYRAHAEQVSRKFNTIQRSSVKKAQDLIYNYLKLEPSEAEKEIQLTLFLEMYEQKESYIKAVEQWLLKLSGANDRTIFFDKKAFRNVLGEWWFRVNRELTPFGIGSYQRFKNSPLAEDYKPSSKMIAKLRVKSILKTGKIALIKKRPL